MNVFFPAPSETSLKLLRPATFRMTDERGRSMVEMLGVLAVMGLLSVVGVIGLRSALDSAKANKLIQALSRRATILAADKSFGTNFTDNASFGQDSDYTITCTDIRDNLFQCDVTGVSQAVCQKILDLKWTLPSLIIPENCSNTNKMIFMFGATLAGEGDVCNEDSDCDTDCFKCDKKTHLCVTKCTGNKPICARYALMGSGDNYRANRRVCCATEQLLDGFCCQSIAEREDGTKTCCMNYQEKCCAIGEFYGRVDCYSCDDPTPRQESRHYSVLDGYTAAFCPRRISAGVMSYFVTDPTNPLASCPDSNNILKPDSNHLIGVKCACPSDKPLQSSSGNCYACTGEPPNVIARGTDWQQCVACNYRRAGGWCQKCDTGTVATPEYNQPCAPCESVDIKALDSKYRCESCPHTKWTGTSDTDGTCGCQEGYAYTSHEDGTAACETEG